MEVEGWPLGKRLYYYQHLAELRQHEQEQVEDDMPEDMPDTPDIDSGEYGMTEGDELPGLNANTPNDPDEKDPIDMDKIHPALRQYDSIVTTGESE